MKSTLCLLSAVCISTVSLSGKINKPNGVFCNDSYSLSIIIDGDTLKMLSCNVDEGALTVCNIEMMTDTFMKINSNYNPGIQALKNMSITYSKQEEDITNPHVIVRFHLPNIQRDMKATIHRGMMDYTGFIRNGACEITMDSNTADSSKPFSFTISPVDYVESNPDGQFYGVLYILYPFEIKYENNDIVTIELPSVNPNLFEMYFIKGEYIHLTRDGLEWRGEIYHRQ